jgi:hypothetical protein
MKETVDFQEKHKRSVVFIRGIYIHIVLCLTVKYCRISESRMPHGGKLMNLISQDNSKLESHPNSMDFELNEGQACDLELMMNGAYSPLDGFMTEETYHHVLHHHRLE